MTSRSVQKHLTSLSEAKQALVHHLLREKARRSVPLRALERSDGEILLAPTTTAQRQLWFLDQLEQGGNAYHLSLALRIRGPLDMPALKRALDELVRRHEALRTTFTAPGGEPVQKISPAGTFDLRHVDVGELATPEQDRAIELHEREVAYSRFDLGTGPLIRGRLISVQTEEHVLLITSHHIISDGWSLNVLQDDLCMLYQRALTGDKPSEGLKLQYADYAQWITSQSRLHSGTAVDPINYWRTQLAGIPSQLELPTDWPRPSQQSYRGATVNFSLDAPLTAALKSLAQRHGMTLFMVLYAAWTALLSRLTGQSDILVGTPTANRTRPELENLIGLFINTIVLRMDASHNLRVDELLRQAKQVTLDAYEHQEAPFASIVEAIHPQRSLSRNPVFQVMFGLETTVSAPPVWPALTVANEPASGETAMFDLSLHLRERGEVIEGSANYSTDLFERQTIERWMGSFKTLLEDFHRKPHLRLGELAILSRNERQQLIESFNATRAPYPRNLRLHELFASQARQSPAALAVIAGQNSLTYAELDRAAEHLARELRNQGVGPDRLVALFVERGIEMVVGLLGVLRAGGAYVPMDPQYPPERLRHMLDDSKPCVVLTQEHLRTKLPQSNAKIIELDKTRKDYAEVSPDASMEAGSPNDLAYVIYTSGSTGKPKGVMVKHSSVVNFLTSMQRSPGIESSDRLLAVTTVSFDIAALEIYLPLISGATVVIASREAASDAGQLIELIDDHDITILQATPVTWRLLLDGGWAGKGDLKALCGGEALPQNLADEVLTRTACLWNLYGPTETTIWSCAGRVSDRAKDHGNVEPIGSPIANTSVHIVDANMRLQPIGIPGEILIGGDGVARGYLNRPELTAERFLRDPFSANPDARCYKTGDLGRWRPNGTIEYLGRNDFQVKIRGFRIELGEIEAQLGSCAQVRQAAVTAHDEGTGHKRLIAYIACVEGRRPDTDDIRKQLRNMLPEYMVPATFVVLPALPLTANGKIDRRSLPAPEASDSSARNFVPPSGELEARLAAIWSNLLNVTRIGRDDNFFELGGHSLHATKLIARLAIELTVRLKVTAVFQHPTVREMAAEIQGRIDEHPMEEGVL